ncbi:MAG: UDP-N-acetylmuramoyl-L-alanyl-D-glutamate--2,6-diaminopimelate ligase [Ezakiella sp.]|nr:UDP-N-acetylmuramoyl-L-alanyl-D-glutamate--2,6-diaminopimelate ligase [Ezakiella sp.]
MKLQELFPKLEIKDKFNYDVDNISTNTKDVNENSVFVAIKGTNVDTHEKKYIDEALSKGCKIFITEKELEFPQNIVQFVVEDTRKTLGLVASSFYSHPSKRVKVIGVTGTKGKTSVTFIVKEILEKMGKRCAIIGTSGAYIGDEHIELKNTTPDSITLQRLLACAVDKKMDYCAMEVSSQAMMQMRVMGTRFLTTVFTNISPDHIGPSEHKDFEDYLYWKKRILMLSRKCIVNADDEHFQEITNGLKNMIITVGKKAHDFKMSEVGHNSFKLNGYEVKTNLIGSYNMYNLALSIAALNEIGFQMSDILKCTHDIYIPGRMELIEKNGREFVIDYAHNSISISSLLKELTNIKKNRIIVVVGSVGGRTFNRRVEIPEAVNAYADEVIYTADNPNFEDPEKIAEEMAKNSTIKTGVIANRAMAIKTAYEKSQAGDIIAILGKGDETHQLVNGEFVSYSDKGVVESL